MRWRAVAARLAALLASTRSTRSKLLQISFHGRDIWPLFELVTVLASIHYRRNRQILNNRQSTPPTILIVVVIALTQGKLIYNKLDLDRWQGRRKYQNAKVYIPRTTRKRKRSTQANQKNNIGRVTSHTTLLMKHRCFSRGLLRMQHTFYRNHPFYNTIYLAKSLYNPYIIFYNSYEIFLALWHLLSFQWFSPF